MVKNKYTPENPFPHKEYDAWYGMMRRCYNPKHKAYKNYGGRGIKVYLPWHNFYTFLNSVGRAPSPELSIDRVDNDKGYTPENVRWVDRLTQARNRRNNAVIEYDGIKKNKSAWNEALNQAPNSNFIQNRLRRGWSIDKTLKTPKLTNEGKGPRPNLIVFNGENKSLKEWSKHLSINLGTLQSRLCSGWSVEKALATPVNLNISKAVMGVRNGKKGKDKNL